MIAKEASVHFPTQDKVIKRRRDRWEAMYGFWVLRHIEEKEDYDSYHAYLEDGGIDLIKELCEKYKVIPNLDQDPGFYKDHGAKRRMRLDDMGTAECSAGMFDMINVDKRFIDQFKKELEELEMKDLANDDEIEKTESLTPNEVTSTLSIALKLTSKDSKSESWAFDGIEINSGGLKSKIVTLNCVSLPLSKRALSV